MQYEINPLDEVAEILVIDTPHVADPLVSVFGLCLLVAHREGHGAVDDWEDDLCLCLHLI